jgi:hypothetical protein
MRDERERLYPFKPSLGKSLKDVRLPSGDVIARSQSWQKQREERLRRFRRELDQKLQRACTFQPNVGAANSFAAHHVASYDAAASSPARGPQGHCIESSQNDTRQRPEEPGKESAKDKGEEASRRLYYQGMAREREKQKLLRAKLQQQFDLICPFQPNAEGELNLAAEHAASFPPRPLPLAHNAMSMAGGEAGGVMQSGAERMAKAGLTKLVREAASGFTNLGSWMGSILAETDASDASGRRSAPPRVHFKDERARDGELLDGGEDRRGGLKKQIMRLESQERIRVDMRGGASVHHYMAPLQPPPKQYSTAERKMLEELEECSFHPRVAAPLEHMHVARSYLSQVSPHMSCTQARTRVSFIASQAPNACISPTASVLIVLLHLLCLC